MTTRDLADGESSEMQGSGTNPYVLKNTGGVYSCTCPAWRNQSVGIERRTCKHLRKLRGDAAEEARLGAPLAAGAAPRPATAKAAPGAPADATSKPAPPVLLAHSWADIQPQPDPAGWWMSEKLDGVRAWWDGKSFWSRLGNPYLAPDWFIDGLPDFLLDGELWVGRKQFQRCVAIVRRQDRPDSWKEVRFRIFDAPGIDAPFETRLAKIQDWIEQAKPAWAEFHPHEPCRSTTHLQKELARVEALGGEGLMLRQPGSKYLAGRSTTLLKVKSFRDTEARVTGHTAGAGKHAGRTGALEVELADGTRFAVGTGLSDAERNDPPPVGSIITVRYQELSNDGVPRFPTYVGIREDMPWPPPAVVAVAAPPVESKASAPIAKAVKPAPPAPAPIAPPAPAVAPAASAGAARRFLFSEGGSSKFWEVEVAGSVLTVRYGRQGSAGQAKSTTCASPEKAAAEAEKLIKEKTGKGYQEQGSAEPAQLPLPDYESPCKRFMNFAVVDFIGKSGEDDEDGDDDEEGGRRSSTLRDLDRSVFRIAVSEDGDESQFQERLTRLLADPGAAKLRGLVFGNWFGEVCDDPLSDAVIAELIAAAPRLTAMRGLFIGDIPAEEAEISWLHQRDFAPVLSAFPALDELAVRGGDGLRFQGEGHAALRTLTIQSGGLSTACLQDLGRFRMPALDRAVLWLGTPSYGGDWSIDDLRPVLDGTAWPNVSALGLMNADNGDDLAQAVAQSAIIDRLRILDLSMGTIGDAGGQALLACPAVAKPGKLKQLVIRHHYLSPATEAALRKLGPHIRLSDRQEGDADDRYPEVTE